MKKLFILAIAICSLCSCAIQSYYGNITTFTPQGDTLQVWNNVLIQRSVGRYTTNAFKDFGVNFIDSTGRGIVIGHAVPFIIDYDTKEKVDTLSTPDYYEEITHDS
jgi:hypothetical protein